MGNRKNAFLILLLVLAGLSYSVCVPYDEDCSSDACCDGLVCQSFATLTGTVQKCTQPPGICSNMPDTYVEPESSASETYVGGPKEKIEELEAGAGVVKGTTGVYSVGWFSDWKAAGLIGVAIAIIIISVAAMIGHGFNMPEVKAFVDTELMQAVVSVLLIISLIGLVVFFDQAARMAIEVQDLPVSCIDSEPCYITSARHYLTTLYDSADQYAGSSLSEGISKQRAASLGVHTQFNFWFLLFAGANIRPNAGLTIGAERASSVFETASKLMASLYSQKYFIDIIAFGIAPIFLLLGILLRTFFFTRKLGGLLLAIAISLFFIYPLTYAFSWYTLNVTVYGERMFANPDPYCPQECTATFPVAFYTEKGTGKLIQFESIQKIIRAGITDANWDTGGPNGEFPGLVACTDLSRIDINVLTGFESGTGDISGSKLTDSSKTWPVNKYQGYTLEVNGKTYPITSNKKDTLEFEGGPIVPALTNAAYDIKGISCSGCPDYCREVPFPASLPGCDIEKCAECNAGCKIIRQRFDCESECLSTCGPECRTTLPVEDKCYFADENKGSLDIEPADLGVSCAGCKQCPTWCKILIDKGSGTYEQYYSNEPACDIPACKPPAPAGTGTCPLQCLYITEIGATDQCESACTTNNVVCPKECRVKELASFVTPIDYDTLDTIPDHCEKDPDVTEACASCPDACKVEIPLPQDNYLTCAAYPHSDPSEKCIDCPVYCRHSNYQFITVPGFSNAPMAGGVPEVCEQGIAGRLDCSALACNNACKSLEEPPLCREYDSTPTAPAEYCKGCPAKARMLLEHAAYFGLAKPYVGSECEDPLCSNSCKPVLVVPAERQVRGAQTTIECRNYGNGPGECSTCPINCRLKNLNDEECNALCSNCPDYCMADASSYGNKGFVCSEFLGNGPLEPGVFQCYGPPLGDCSDANHQASPATCTADPDENCVWAEKGSLTVPIEYREDEYNDRSICKQCPENCRIKGYEGDCGVFDNEGQKYVDCREVSCPDACKAELPPESSVCEAEHPFGLPCEQCPALCRRIGDTPPGCPAGFCSDYNPETGLGCTLECRVEDAPDYICEGCFDCPLDCTYYPAVRTDCADICSDEALTGPVNIGPDDFIKKLPGAQGATDVKSIGVLMVPALVLPLFNIVIVIAFIRVFSPVLGGDIQIPGLSKII